MKNRLIPAGIAALFVCNFAYAQPIPTVPESGSTLGLLVIGLIAFVALRRKFTK